MVERYIAYLTTLDQRYWKRLFRFPNFGRFRDVSGYPYCRLIILCRNVSRNENILFLIQSFLFVYFISNRSKSKNNQHFGYLENENNRLKNIKYPLRNDFTSLSFNFRKGDGIGNEKSFPVSLLQTAKLRVQASNPANFFMMVKQNMTCRLGFGQNCFKVLPVSA